MQNTIVKTLIYDKQVRLLLIDNTKLMNDILSLNRGTNKILKLTLGKTISAVSLIAGTLKGNQRISLQLTMSEPKYKIFADADANGNIRGYLNEALLKAAKKQLKDLSLNHLIGNNGTIRVIKGSEMHQFTGITDMPYRNIVDDISHYFNQSEQTQTFIGTNLTLTKDNFVQHSNAVYAQLLPGASHDLLIRVRHIFLTNRNFFTNLLKQPNIKIEEKLSELFEDVKVIGYSPVQFFCGCSKEMFYGILHSLSENDLPNHEDIETVCQICGRSYHFSYNEVQRLLN